MAQGLGEARTHLARSFEELVGKVLCKEGKHEVGALWVGCELSPEQEAMAQDLGIWQLLLPWMASGKEQWLPPVCIFLPRTSWARHTKLVHTGSPERPPQDHLPPDRWSLASSLPKETPRSICG